MSDLKEIRQRVSNGYAASSMIRMYRDCLEDARALLAIADAQQAALVACYHAGHRMGWQEGPTTDEAMSMVVDLVPLDVLKAGKKGGAA